MAANTARELLQICNLSWVPGFITHRGPSALLSRASALSSEDCWSRLPLSMFTPSHSWFSWE